MAAREQANSVRRSGFFNPFIGKRPFFRPGSGQTAETERPRPPQHSYCTEVGSFKFIAPRCLDEEAPPTSDAVYTWAPWSAHPKCTAMAQSTTC